MIKGACLIGQSGGPTAVINSSLAGVVMTALNNSNITNVYGALHGIQGVLDEQFIDFSLEDINEIELLKYTPSSALGSVRFFLEDFEKNSAVYEELLKVFKKYNIRYFFYIGGNDSMDSCMKINKYFKYLASSLFKYNVLFINTTFLFIVRHSFSSLILLNPK